MKSNNQNDFIKNYRNIWADNGDSISYHYTGTGSTHTEYIHADLVSPEMGKGDGLAILNINIKPSPDFIIKTFGISIK